MSAPAASWVPVTLKCSVCGERKPVFCKPEDYDEYLREFGRLQPDGTMLIECDEHGFPFRDLPVTVTKAVDRGD